MEDPFEPGLPQAKVSQRAPAEEGVVSQPEAEAELKCIKWLLCPSAKDILEDEKELVAMLRVKCHPYKNIDGKFLLSEPNLIKDLHNAYLWSLTASSGLSEMDLAFLAFRACGQASATYEFREHVMYGLHSYGGYYLFFRPDLAEVFWLMSQHIPQEDLKRCVAFYVTTDPWPSDFAMSCYDFEQDRHRAKTQCFLVTTKPPPLPPTPPHGEKK